MDDKELTEGDENSQQDETSVENTEEDTTKGTENIKKKVTEAYKQDEDFKDKYLRAMADMENLRRRQIQEREDSVTRTRSQIFSDLLPIIDAFQMGIAEAEKDESAKNIFIGVSMAFQQMKNTLGEYGLELIYPEGKEFDPKFHEALSYESSPDTEEGIVLKSVRIGYKMKDKLLRPASVIISKGTTEDK
jgi:molecular chaperone GrpE